MMPALAPIDFGVTNKIVADFVRTNSPAAIHASVTNTSGLDRAMQLVRQYRPNAPAVDPNVAVAVRKHETDPRWKDASVGDIRDKSKRAEYDKLSAEERYALRDQFKAWGPFQIHKVVVDDINRVYKTNYSHEDAFDRKKAAEMFKLYSAIYAKPGDTPEDIARRWNGGPRGNVRNATTSYWNKVQQIFNTLTSTNRAGE